MGPEKPDVNPWVYNHGTCLKLGQPVPGQLAQAQESFQTAGVNTSDTAQGWACSADEAQASHLSSVPFAMATSSLLPGPGGEAEAALGMPTPCSHGIRPGGIFPVCTSACPRRRAGDVLSLIKDNPI